MRAAAKLAGMQLIPCSVALVLLATLGACASTPPAPALAASDSDGAPPRVLVFTRTAGFRHDAIPVTVDTLRTLGGATGLTIETSEDPARFDDATLAGYRAVVFAHTTREVLDAPQQAAFERYVAGGGGYMGIHAAADSGYTWPWYGDLVGAWFARHPEGLQSRGDGVDRHDDASRREDGQRPSHRLVPHECRRPGLVHGAGARHRAVCRSGVPGAVAAGIVVRDGVGGRVLSASTRIRWRCT